MSQFGIQAIKMNNVFYGGVIGDQKDEGRRFLSDGDTGAVHETLHAILQAKPAAEWTSRAGKSWLDALVDSTDAPVKQLDAVNGLVMYGAKGASQLPGYDASSVHDSRTCLRGLVFLQGIRWSLGDAAEFALRAMLRQAAGSGATNPVTEAQNVALPTQVVSAEAFVLTALTLNGVAVKGVRSLDLSIDPKFQWEHDTGLAYPIDIIGAGVNGPAEIRLSVDTTDVGLALEGTGAVSFVLTSLAQAGTLGANTITGTLNSAWTLKDTDTGSKGNAIMRKLIVRPRYNGATKPLTLVTA